MNVIRLIKKLKPYTILKGIRYLKHYGFKEFFVRLGERMEPEEVPYGPWYETHKVMPSELERQRKHKFRSSPRISVLVPAYHTPPAFLRELLDSILSQSYENWELIIANASPDDEDMKRILKEYIEQENVRAKQSSKGAESKCRIVVIDIPENKGIAWNTNRALEASTGDFVGLLDHDDLLSPDALFLVASHIDKDEQIDVLYTDEDKVTPDLSEHFQPNLKPDFNLDLLRSNNYITHFYVARRKLAVDVGGFLSEYDGAQDYDFIFRTTEGARRICHIPRILYHWRTHKDSTADNPESKLYAYEAGKKAIEASIERANISGASVSMTADFGFYQVDYPVRETSLISIIIPNKDEAETLKCCITSILEKSTYANFEILVVENNSEKDETFAYYEEISRDERIRVIHYEGGFNFSAINNFAVNEAAGDYLLFLNNDIEVITPDFLEKMLSNCQRDEVGIAGAKLYYPDDTIQHAGIIIGIGGIAGHAFLGMKRSRSGYLHKASIQLDYSAVTAACMMVKRSVFEEIGGFEEKLTVAFNDVDLCLRVVQAGYLCVYLPRVEMVHYESKSRGTEDSEEKVRRFQSEIEFMRTRYEKLLKDGDPYYNKNLTLSKWNYSLRA